MFSLKLNTNQEELSVFDIIVAQTEAQTGESLHDLVEAMSRDIPEIRSYASVDNLVLRVAALRENREPTEPSFLRLNLTNLIADWDRIRQGVSGCDGVS